MKIRNKKTGEIIETDYKLAIGVPTARTFGCKSYDQIASYDSLTELNEEWEDCKPAEPLIKDEKVRKAVKAWAEVVGKEETFVVSYNAEYHDCCIYTAGLSTTAMIDLGIDLNIKEGSYSITELCDGEEE